MPRILHLTDLHLGDRPEDQILDDYKSDIVPYAERVTRQALLKSTLRNLGRYLRAKKMALDAVVVSGDVTVAGDPAGLELLSGVLAELQDTLPPADHIVVVPGNHDVSWRTPASSPDRYKNFIGSLRVKGYITPLLDGVDVPCHGSSTDYSRHHLALDGGAIEIIPLNSSNYCGTIEPLRGLTEGEWDTLPGLLMGRDTVSVRKELNRLRLHDVARFSPQQLDSISELLDTVCPLDARDKQIRIAVLHHQLLPVSASEEFKSYEAIINLGVLQNFLRANSFDIVLHGHKHTPLAYWYNLDSSHGGGLAGPTKKARSLVISGSTVSCSDSRRGEMCSLIALPSRTAAKEVRVTPVPPADAGTALENLEENRYRLWDLADICSESMDAPKVVTAESFDVVYDQLLSYFAERSEHDSVNHLVCEVRNATYPVGLPVNYPDVPATFDGNRQVWLDDLVRWWQHMKPARDDPSAFTHGARIYNYGGFHDQFRGAIGALQQKQNSSRAIVALVDPSQDGWDSRRKAPSFCSFQFLITKRGKDIVLDCIAYFRKQEMRYWWPVNFAELALMQNNAVERLSPSYIGLRSGSIVTIAAIAYASQALPKVAVPIIDRLVDEDPDTLWQLAHSLVWPTASVTQHIKPKWERLLADLTPTPKPDPDGVPVALQGLGDLIREVGRFKRFHAGPDIDEVLVILSGLLQVNTAYARETSTNEPTIERHDKWRSDCALLIDQLRAVLRRCWARSENGELSEANT